MAKKSFDQNRLVEMYMAGLPIPQIMKEFNASQAWVFSNCRKLGIKRRKFVYEVIGQKAVDLYLSGVSENEVANRLGVGRTAIRIALVKAGVAIRNQSESEKLKWSQMTEAQRKKQVEKANQSIRSKPKEFHWESSVKQAITKQRSLAKVGSLEKEFGLAFADLGKPCIPQLAFDVYNIDLAIGRSAIEIHVNPSHPHTHKFYRKRIEYLLKGGWNVFYIKIANKVLLHRAAEKISQMIDLIEANKSTVRHYGVIRGSGELIASGSLNGDHLACVEASKGFFAALEAD